MRVPHVVHLEVKRVLQVIARLLAVQAAYDGGLLGDPGDHHAVGFRQRPGGVPDLRGGRYPVGAAAQISWLSGQMSHSSLMP